MREVLHEDDELTVTMVLDDTQARVELQSCEGGPDLTDEYEVVVVVDGRGRSVEAESPQHAEAIIVDELAEDPQPITLMVRVYEFFEGWELFDEG